MAASTRAAMSGVSRSVRRFSTRDTVALDTPATRATSAMVARAVGFATGWGVSVRVDMAEW